MQARAISFLSTRSDRPVATRLPSVPPVVRGFMVIAIDGSAQSRNVASSPAADELYNIRQGVRRPVRRPRVTAFDVLVSSTGPWRTR